MFENNIDPDILEEAKKRMIWMTYKGKKILYNDYRNLQGSEIPDILDAILSLTLKSGEKGYLNLVDVRDSYANKETIDAFNKGAKAVKDITDKTAVLGITGVKKILLNVVNKFSNMGAKAFDTIEEAKEWLVE